jgi:phosphoenolpyruvate synthase/pyruvate phosphate dikinase
MNGKAAGLAMLQDLAPVPSFIVVTDPDHIDTPTLLGAVDGAGLREPFAVRSSAGTEDGPDAAYAGMFDTHLGVARDALREAVRSVCDSARSLRVLAYSEAHGVAATTRMSIIVQEMVDARVAGVCVTRLPDAQPNLVTIESVWGLGETLVSGSATPDMTHIDRDTRQITRGKPGNQVVELRLQGGKQLVAPHLRSVTKLTDAEILAVTNAALAVESATKWHGVDLEWAFDSKQLWILQARPVTSLAA